MLNAFKVYRSPNFFISRQKVSRVELLGNSMDRLVDESTLGEEFSYRCLTTFKPRFDSSTRARVLTIVTTSCGSSVI